MHASVEIPVRRRRRIKSSFLPSFLPLPSQPFLHFFGFGRQVAVHSSGRRTSDGRTEVRGRRLLGCSVAAAVEWADGGDQRLRRWFGQVQPATGWRGGRKGEIDLGSLQGGAKHLKLGCLIETQRVNSYYLTENVKYFVKLEQKV